MLKVRLKEVLNQYGYTLYDLSDAILDLEGISESTIYRFARGEQNLTLKKLELILSAVRSLTGQAVRLSDLIGDEASITPSLADEPGSKAEPSLAVEPSTSNLVLFSRAQTVEEVEDVWDLIALAQRPRRQLPQRPTRRWFLTFSAIGFMGAAFLLGSLAPDGTQVATFLTRPFGLTSPEQAIRVIQGTDDAEESLLSGQVYRDSNDLELVDDAAQNGHQLVGLRFQNVKLSAGATVDAAYIEFRADSSDDVATALTIRGEASDAADTFRTTTANLSGRSVTSAAITWHALAPWEVGQTYRTPDLSPIVQEVIDRNGWSSGNSIAFIITGSGSRTAESFESRPADAPLLHIKYSQ